jgi:hypothetical protein
MDATDGGISFYSDMPSLDMHANDEKVDVTRISIPSRLMSAFCKFYDRYNDLIYNNKLSLSHMLSDIFHTNS